MSTNHTQPFFIFGSPRSGTSLLSRMMDSHPDIVVPNESLVFKMFYPHLRLYGDLNQHKNQLNLLKDILDTRVIGYWRPALHFDNVARLIQKPGFAGVVEALICSTKQGSVKCWGEKSPGHVFFWDDIKREFPNSKIIHILRDGRDVGSSIIRARMGPKTMVAAANMWKCYVEEIDEIASSCSPRDFCEIRYESLLNAPKDSLTRVCQHLGVEYSESMLNFHKEDTNYQTDKTNLSNLTQPLMAGNHSKWKKTLSQKELQHFESIAGDTLLKKGFELGCQLNNLRPLQLLYHQKIRSPFIRFFSRASDFQGQLEFLNLKWILLKRAIKNRSR